MYMGIILKKLAFERFSGLYIFALLIVGFSIWMPDLFFSLATLRSVASDKSISAMLALSLIIPLSCGTFDLSVAANINFSTLLVIKLINGKNEDGIASGLPLPLAILVTILVAALIGFVNGFIVVKLKVSSFIATLGTASIIAAMMVVLTGNRQPLPAVSSAWKSISTTQFLGFQAVVFYMLAIALIVWFVLDHTPTGRYLFAIGSNADASRLSGVRVDAYIWMSLVASGAICGLAGVFYGSLAGPSLTYGGGLLLPAFAAVFLGSTQISPGRFNVWGTVLSIYLLATGVKGLQLATDVQWLSPLFSGVALIVAVSVALNRQDSLVEKKRRKSVEAVSAGE